MLVSGTGSILEAILEDRIAVSQVIADRPCRGLEIAAAAGIDAQLVDRRDWGGFGESFDRDGLHPGGHERVAGTTRSTSWRWPDSERCSRNPFTTHFR